MMGVRLSTDCRDRGDDQKASPGYLLYPIYYRAFAHSFAKNGSILGPKLSVIINIIKGLSSVDSGHYTKNSRLICTHISLTTYRAFVHFFTVLSPIISESPQARTRNKVTKAIKGKLSPNPVRSLVTVISPIFLPLHQSFTYRPLNHCATALPIIEKEVSTVLPVIKRVAKELKLKTNSACKVVKNYELKRTSLFDDVLFLEIGRGISL